MDPVTPPVLSFSAAGLKASGVVRNSVITLRRFWGLGRAVKNLVQVTRSDDTGLWGNYRTALDDQEFNADEEWIDLGFFPFGDYSLVSVENPQENKDLTSG